MWPEQGPLIYESGALPTALRGPAAISVSPHVCFILVLILISMFLR